jgi:folate-binding protein YgfZ
MNRITSWQSQLAANGASVDNNGLVSDFGDRLTELRALQEAAVLVPLTHIGAIEVSGDDAQRFLNTQLTSDLAQVTANAAQYSGYCSPKGRLLATFLVVLRGNDYLLMLPREITGSVADRLKRYVLRAKVNVETRSDDYALLGIAGPKAASVIGQVLGQAPADSMQAAEFGATTVVTLPGCRHFMICDRDQVEEQWNALSKLAKPAGGQAWELQSIRAGVATVTAATQESFVPQMLGQEKIGAVSFEKGCYPGQEIVARTQYLGNLKRQLYYGRSDKLLDPGDAISNSSTGKTAGTVTNAAPNLDDKWEFLAVLQRDAIEAGMSLTSTREQSIQVEQPAADIVAEGLR